MFSEWDADNKFGCTNDMGDCINASTSILAGDKISQSYDAK